MEKLLVFIETHTIEEQHYWQIPRLYTSCDSPVIYEISWERGKASPWRLKALEDDLWHEATSVQMPDILLAEMVDLQLFEVELTNTILREAVYASSVLKSIKKLLGTKAVEKAIIDNEIFLDNLKSMIEQVIKQNELNSEKSSDKLADTERKNLRLISGTSCP